MFKPAPLSEEHKAVCLRCNSTSSTEPFHLLCPSCINSPDDDEVATLHVCRREECALEFCPKCPPRQTRDTQFCARCHEVCCMNCAQRDHKHDNKRLQIRGGTSVYDSFLEYTKSLSEMASESPQLRAQLSWVNKVFWVWREEGQLNYPCRFRLLHLIKQRLALFKEKCLVPPENRLIPQIELGSFERPVSVSVSPSSEVYVLDERKRELHVLNLSDPEVKNVRYVPFAEQFGTPTAVVAWKEESVLVLCQPLFKVQKQARILEIFRDGSWNVWLVHPRLPGPSSFAVCPKNEWIAVVNLNPPRLSIARPEMRDYREIPLGGETFKKLTGVTFLTSNCLALLDGETERITIINLDADALNQTTTIAPFEDSPEKTAAPKGLASLPDGKFLVSFAGNRRLCLLDQEGALLREFGNPNSCSVAVDRRLNVYVCYPDDQKVEKFDELLSDLLFL